MDTLCAHQTYTLKMVNMSHEELNPLIKSSESAQAILVSHQKLSVYYDRMHVAKLTKRV
jgi:hypothetical protein